MSKPIRVAPRLKPTAYSQHDLDVPSEAPTLEPLSDGPEGFFKTDENPFDRRGFKYSPCRPNPYFESTKYSTTDLPPYKVRMSYFDRSPKTYVNEEMDTATSERGWRSARTNVGLREGKWYIEYKLVHANDVEDDSHVRFGIGRREASIEAPVGYDGYGYGFRDKLGQRVHLSKPETFFKSGDGFKSGDVIGLLVELPPMDVQMEIARQQINKRTTDDPNEAEAASTSVEPEDASVFKNFTQVGVTRDAIPIKYRSRLFFEQFEYTSSQQMEHLLYPVTVFGEHAVRDKKTFKPAVLPDSRITVFKNGRKVGVAFEGLFAYLPPCSEQRELNLNLHRKLHRFYVGRDDGSLGYYPMVSCYNKGVVKINSTKKLEKTPVGLSKDIKSGEVRLLADRYNEQVVENYVYDLVDEATSAYLDRMEALQAPL